MKKYTLEENIRGVDGKIDPLLLKCKSPKYVFERDQISRNIFYFFIGISKFRNSQSRLPQRSEEDFQLFMELLMNEISLNDRSDSKSLPFNEIFLKTSVYQSSGFVPAIVFIL